MTAAVVFRSEKRFSLRKTLPRATQPRFPSLEKLPFFVAKNSNRGFSLRKTVEMPHKKPVVRCPRCGSDGVESVLRVKAKGHTYYYLGVLHADGRKCVIRRLSEPPRAEPAEELQKKLAELQRRVEELEREREVLQQKLAEAEARAHIAQQVFAASLRLGPHELEALRAVYISKRGYSAEQASAAKGVMHTIVSRGLEAGLAVVSFPSPEQAAALF